MRVTDEFRLMAGYSRVESEIKKNTSRPTSVGNKSPYTPDYTATLGAELDVPVGAAGWHVQGSAFYNIVGPTWFHVIQAQNNETVAFGTGNYTNGRARQVRHGRCALRRWPPTTGRWRWSARTSPTSASCRK